MKECDSFTLALNSGDPCKVGCLSTPRRQEPVAFPQSQPHVVSIMPFFLSPGLRGRERLARSADPFEFHPAK